ncbi:MAG TPA: STAS domain-containing protein [Pirellulaceae bacterium]|nr:STAS domain-containing protein [Pirellulaceae bacterium]
MVTATAAQWTFTLERGPDWLFIKVHGPENGDSEGVPLAEMIWTLMQQEFTRRVVLELDELRIMRSCTIAQLVRLHKRILTHDGLMRIAGLSPDNYNVLVACRLHERLPNYSSRAAAVMGERPTQPR